MALNILLYPEIPTKPGAPQTTYTYYTAPSGPSSINSSGDVILSTEATLPSLLPLLPHYNAFLIACFSPHTLIPALKSHTHKPVIGIFEASIATALQLLPALNPQPKHESSHTTSIPPALSPVSPRFSKFGIVSTSAAWGPILTSAVESSNLGMLGSLAPHFFNGVETIGLNASDLHPPSSSPSPASLNLSPNTNTSSVPVPDQFPSSSSSSSEPSIEARVRAATRRLLSRSDSEEGEEGEVRVVVLGCAGMVGMERWVREEAGKDGKVVVVVDGVKAGVGILQGLVRGVVGDGV